MPDWLSIMDFSYIAVRNIPILSTNSANKLYDSLAAGKICITNIEGWMQRMLEKERCGLNTDPLNPSSFIEKIKPFLENEEMTRKSIPLTQGQLRKSITVRQSYLKSY